jgi:hypothetical protein
MSMSAISFKGEEEKKFERYWIKYEEGVGLTPALTRCNDEKIFLLQKNP